MNNPELVSCNEEDFLDQDSALRGQNYYCASFISPEDVIKQKELHFFYKFQEDYAQDFKKLFTDLMDELPEKKNVFEAFMRKYEYMFNINDMESQYKFFLSKNQEGLEKEYHEINNFQTSIRGFKMSGSFETLKEAQIRAQIIKRKNKYANIFIGEVGCWCPWNPDPNNIIEQEHQEAHLNTLMKKYRDNETNKEMMYEERKDEMKREMELENQRKKEQLENNTEVENTEVENTEVENVEIENVTIESNTETTENSSLMEGDDAWMKRKNEENTE